MFRQQFHFLTSCMWYELLRPQSSAMRFSKIRDGNMKWHCLQKKKVKDFIAIRYIDVIVITDAFDMRNMLLSRFAPKCLRATYEKFWNTNCRAKKSKKKKKYGGYRWRTYFSLRRKSSIICHLLGLKVSDESLKGSSVGNQPLKK